MNSSRILLTLFVPLTLSASVAVGVAVPADPCDLFETSKGTSGVVNYILQNNTGVTTTAPPNPCDIVGFVVSTPAGVTVGTSNANWTAQALTAADWNQPMGGIAGNDTWQQMTGKAFTDVFTPVDPCVGYFLNYTIGNTGLGGISQFTFASGSIAPGESLGDFGRTGEEASAFLAFGVPDSSNFASDPGADPVSGVSDFTGTATVPEPGSLSLLGMMMTGLLMRRRGNR